MCCGGQSTGQESTPTLDVLTVFETLLELRKKVGYWNHKRISCTIYHTFGRAVMSEFWST